MASPLFTPSSEFGWQSGRGRSKRFSWRKIFWILVFPQAGQRTGLTAAGLLLILLSMAIGVAAYNSASNILFLTLSLLLGCLILSGMLSWLNFRRLQWRVEIEAPVRAGVEHAVTLAVRNQKRFLPTYGLWFELELARSGENFAIALRGRLDARTETRLLGSIRILSRGVEQVRLLSVGSLFPFGFLRKSFSARAEREVVVWPAAISYRRMGASLWQRADSGATLRRVGQSGDLLALRRYQQGDSHRQIHWKASARLRHLMVRQNAAESGENFSLWVDLANERWARPEQFELLCSFAASLAEDLFKLGKLRSASVADDPPTPIRRLRDVEWFLDRLALAQPSKLPTSARPKIASAQAPNLLNLVTFVPEGTRGVSAYVNGERAATT